MLRIEAPLTLPTIVTLGVSLGGSGSDLAMKTPPLSSTSTFSPLKTKTASRSPSRVATKFHAGNDFSNASRRRSPTGFPPSQPSISRTPVSPRIEVCIEAIDQRVNRCNRVVQTGEHPVDEVGALPIDGG